MPPLTKRMRESSHSELISHLKSFLLGCPISVFLPRLIFVWHLIHTLKPLVPNETFSEWASLINHYSELAWLVEHRIIEERQAAEQPMRDIQQIMNWYFEDMVNLQMNVEKLYRGVNRCLKLQEDAMGRSVEAVVLTEQRGRFREKTTEGLVQRMKEEQMGYSREGQKSCHVDKTGFERMVGTMLGGEVQDLFMGNFRMMRHVSISQMITCMGIVGEHSWVVGSHPDSDRESKVKLLRQIKSQKPKFKDYYNGGECLQEYIAQTLDGVNRVQSRTKKFKARFLLDFIKGYKQNFDVRSGLNVNSLSFAQVIIPQIN